MNALYRPGPMEYIPDFVARKHGKQEITYDLKEMEEYLEDTYGITVYQEQVMRLSQELAGFTPGMADTLRSAMGKRDSKSIEKPSTISLWRELWPKVTRKRFWKRSGRTGRVSQSMRSTSHTPPVMPGWAIRPVISRHTILLSSWLLTQ